MIRSIIIEHLLVLRNIKKIDEDYRLDVQDPELKKALHLTTEDLRFTENLVQHVCDVPEYLKSDEPDVFLDGIGWVSPII